MNVLSIRCIKFAFVYLAFGIGLGVWFAVDRAQARGCGRCTPS